MASPSDQAYIDLAIDEIQQTLNQIGVNKNLNSIPIIVTDSISGDGKCINSGNSRSILIHKRLFQYEDLDPNLQQISRLWSVLLHEIGHCYFYRSHEHKEVFADDGYVFQLSHKIKFQQAYHCFHSHNSSWPGTVMGPQGISVAPESLKEFYIKELVGQFPVPDTRDILQPPIISLTEETNISDSSFSTECPR